MKLNNSQFVAFCKYLHRFNIAEPDGSPLKSDDWLMLEKRYKSSMVVQSEKDDIAKKLCLDVSA